MGINEGSLLVFDIEVILENSPIILLYGSYIPVAVVVFTNDAMSYIWDSMSKR